MNGNRKLVLKCELIFNDFSVFEAFPLTWQHEHLLPFCASKTEPFLSLALIVWI